MMIHLVTENVWTLPTEASNEDISKTLSKILDGTSTDHVPGQLSGKWEALCVFLSARSTTDIRRLVAMRYDHIAGDHLVLIQYPSMHLLGELPPLGTAVRMTVTDIVFDETSQWAIVHIPTSIRRHISLPTPPRILLSSQHSIDRPNTTAALLASAPTAADEEYQDIPDHLEIVGTLGLLVSRGPDRPPRKVIHRDDLQNEVDLPETISTIDDVQRSPIDGWSEVTVLHVFDFDGTLMNSPDECIGKREYQEALGVPYPHLGWYGRIESLRPPIRVLPGPAFGDCRRHYGRSSSWTVVLTGRIKRVRTEIEAVLRSYDVDYDELICKAGYTDTQTFKIATIMKLIGRFDKVKTIKIWDDNVENLSEMYRLQKSLDGRIDVQIIEAPTMPPPKSLEMGYFSWEERHDLKGIASFLEATGKLPDRDYWLHAESSIEILVEAWKGILNVDCCLTDLFFVLGVHVFGIRQIIDLRLLTPQGRSVVDCMKQLSERLTEMKIDWSMQDACLRVKLRFAQCCPIDYRIGCVHIQDTTISQAFASAADLRGRLCLEDIDSLMAVDTLMSMEKVAKIGDTRMTRRAIRTALALTDQILTIHEKMTDGLEFYPIDRMAEFLDGYPQLDDVSSDAFCMDFVRYMGRTMPSSKTQETTLEAAVEIHAIQILMETISRQFPVASNDLQWTEIHDILVRHR